MSNYQTTAAKTKRHGHQGNTKKWLVLSRPRLKDRQGMEAYGCADVDAFTPCHYGALRLTQADRMIDRMERLGLETRLINLNSKERA